MDYKNSIKNLIPSTADIRSGPTQGATIKPVVSVHITNSQQLKAAELKGESIPLSEQQLIKAIERAVKAIQGPTTTFEFSVHEQTKQIMVKVLDKETGEIIREIPPEKQLDLVAKLWEMAGILVDEKV
jgi:flagellar protein FlaG